MPQPGHGQNRVICDRCGFKYWSGQLRREWTGLRVCSGASTNGCFEERHPQDLIRAKRDRQAPEWVRPEQPDSFLTVREWDDDAKAWVEAS